MLFWNSSGHLLDTTNPELSYFKLSYLFEEHKDSVGRGTSVQSSLRLMPIAFHSAWHRPYQVHISLIKDETTINLFFGSVSSQSKNKICSCRCQKNLEVTFVRKIRLSPNKPAVSNVCTVWIILNSCQPNFDKYDFCFCWEIFRTMWTSVFQVKIFQELVFKIAVKS